MTRDHLQLREAQARLCSGPDCAVRRTFLRLYNMFKLLHIVINPLLGLFKTTIAITAASRSE